MIQDKRLRPGLRSGKEAKLIHKDLGAMSNVQCPKERTHAKTNLLQLGEGEHPDAFEGGMFVANVKILLNRLAHAQFTH